MYSNQVSYKKLISSKLGYDFKNEILLAQAITRKSGLQESYQDKSVGHNETLATLGDGILRAVIDRVLIETNPTFAKGELSPERDKLVNNKLLCQIAEKLELQQFIIIGKGEKKNLQTEGRTKILATCLEAIIGAIFIDCNESFTIIKKFIIQHWDLQAKYHPLLIKAVLAQDAFQVEALLNLGIDPNTTGSANIYKCSGLFNKKAKTITLFGGYYDNATLLHLAIISKRHRPAELAQSVKPGTDYGQQGIYKDGNLQFISEKPEKIPHDINLEGLLSLLRPIDFGGMGMARSLTLPKEHPGVQKLIPLFSPEVSKECIQIIKLLISHGADINNRAWWGDTVLHTAVILRNVEVIKLFIEAGADISAVNNEGKTPRDLTTDKEIIQLFSTNSSVREESGISVKLLNNLGFLKPDQSNIAPSFPNAVATGHKQNRPVKN